MPDSPLQKAPTGLLGALNLKTQGRYPQLFGETLVPVLELTDFYLHPNRTALTFAAALTVGPGQVGTLVVPDGQAWSVKGISVVLARAAGDAALTPEFDVNLLRGLSFGLSIFNAQFSAVAATDLLQTRGVWLPRRILMSGGDQFELRQRTTFAGAGQAGVTIDVDVFPL